MTCRMTNFLLVFLLVIRNKLALSTRTSSRSKTFSDSYVVFRDHDELSYGFIEAIFHVIQDDIYLIKVNLLQDKKFDCLLLNGKEYVNEHIIYGHFSGNHCRIISATDVVEKGCYYDGENGSFFARFPNMYESS